MSFLRDAAVNLVVALKGTTLTREAEKALHVLSEEIVRSAEVEENQKKRKHSCPDWDYMVIDEDSPEFDACLCFKEEQKPVVWLDNGLGVFYWASEFNDRPVPPGFEPLYAAQPRIWSNVTDDALIEEVRYRGFTIRDAQISPKRWVGLTDGDIAQTMHGSVEGSNMLPYQFARAIEAKLKEKNA